MADARVVGVKIGYQTDGTVPLKEVPDTAAAGQQTE